MFIKLENFLDYLEVKNDEELEITTNFTFSKISTSMCWDHVDYGCPSDCSHYQCGCVGNSSCMAIK